MPVNRLQRDDLLIQALDMADLPELDQHDRPSSVILSTAFAINWLQRCLDEMFQVFPWAGTFTNTTGTVTLLNTTSLAPTDFILDVRDGLYINTGGSLRQLRRRNVSDIIPYQARNDQGGNPITGTPSLYAFSGRTLRLNTLWYYAMPSVLAATDTPTFPSDHVLVDFVYLRALEWARKVPQGSAMKYLREVEIPALRNAGLNQEPETDHIMLDPLQFKGRRRVAWGSGPWPGGGGIGQDG